MHLCFTDHILRALSSLQTTEEKLAALCKKYADLHEEHRVLQSTHKQHQRKLAMVHFSLSLSLSLSLSHIKPEVFSHVLISH